MWSAPLQWSQMCAPSLLAITSTRVIQAGCQVSRLSWSPSVKLVSIFTEKLTVNQSFHYCDLWWGNSLLLAGEERCKCMINLTAGNNGRLEDINHQLCFWPLWGNDWCKFVANYDEWNCYISNPGLTTSLQHSQGWDVSWALRVSVLWYKYRLWWCHAAWPLHRHRSGVNSPLGLSCFAQVKWRT